MATTSAKKQAMTGGTKVFRMCCSTSFTHCIPMKVNLRNSSSPWPTGGWRRYGPWEDMKPLQGGVPEPEAAGALAWIFYQAYSQTGDEKYRIGAELCMEFFSDWQENPSYELQYLYGAVLAARMNAEMGTGYDLEKIMNWCFDVGPLRLWAHTLGWGMVVDNWNGMDVSGINTAPVIERIILDPARTNMGDTVSLRCMATDAEDQEPSYSWTSAAGSFVNLYTQQTTWNAPQEPGEYTLYCEVTDTYHATTTDSVIVRVEDLSFYQEGNMIARYPFNGNANDLSGNGNNGTAYNTYNTTARGGAYEFNGVNSSVMVPGSETLNCNEAITVTFWMKPTKRFDRETYPISHGLWHNRWKVSIGDDLVRWTIRTNDKGNIIITDLDSDTKVKLNEFIQVTATYDGQYSDLFINGVFEGFLHQEGLIEDTDVAMTIGQASPTATNNNFQGILDEIRIYDYALSHEDIKEAYQNDLLNYTENRKPEPLKFNIFPNPFSTQTTISFQLKSTSLVDIRIFNVMGQLVTVLQSGPQQPGWFRSTW